MQMHVCHLNSKVSYKFEGGHHDSDFESYDRGLPAYTMLFSAYSFVLVFLFGK